MSVTIYLIYLDLFFLDKGSKTKIKQEYYIEVKRFCTVEETISQIVGQPTEWVKIFAYHISHKGFIAKIYE